MDDPTEVQGLRRDVFALRERCEVLEAALARVQAAQMDREGLRVVPVGRIPIDGAALMVVDPMYIETSWVRTDEADAIALSLGPGEWARALAEPVERSGHHVEWVKPIQLRVTPREGTTAEALRDEAVGLVGAGGPVGAVFLVRPGATMSRISGSFEPRLVKLKEGAIGLPEAAVVSLGGDGTATVLALVDEDGYTRRIEVDVRA